MALAILVLILAAALFFFYVQTVCQKVLQREFDRSYAEDILAAIQLDYPRLLADRSDASFDYSGTRLGLQCDFVALSYLLKNGKRIQHSLSQQEKFLLLYFRFLLFCLPIRHALQLHENEAVLKLATILQFFANLVGEKLTVSARPHLVPNPQS